MTHPAGDLRAEPLAVMSSIIGRIATGPELSKDISREEARTGMRFILNGDVDPVQAGIFLIALRMKRETDEENQGILEALLDVTQSATAQVPEVVDLADPYDGYSRTLPASPFLPAVLAACGVPCISHGVERMGPKYGVTHRQVLAAAGVPVDLTAAQAAARVSEAQIAWSYVDQKAFCPKLYDLAHLRSLIVKRPAITAAETLLPAVRGQVRTHLVTGYVHKPYPRIYALLARRAGFDSALIVRGVEGGVIPALRQVGKAFYYHHGGEERSVEFRPGELGIEQSVLAPSISGRAERDTDSEDRSTTAPDQAAVARAAAQAGMEALSGRGDGATRDSLICGASLCLWHLRRQDSLPSAAAAVRKVLDSGAARERVLRAINTKL
ncbi:MAG TPA: hypothetical protein VEI05_03220 [Burkholderiaceae bacterium]|nr:hypothetical protein [Burkholderiaceae bacterium]